MWESVLLSVLLLSWVPSSLEEPVPGNSLDNHMDLIMPGARPMTDDSYLCSSFEISSMTGSQDPVYVTGFEPSADASRAHHMLLYTCNSPMKQPGEVYDCLHHSLCMDGSSIMFAWAKNAPPTTLPKGVAFKADPSTKKYFVLQVHYKKPLADPDNTGLSLIYQTEAAKYQAGIFLLLKGGMTIPANTPTVHGDINCKLPANVPIHMFAYRTHAHALSTVISGYVYNEDRNEYREIAKGSPQWPQAFYPMKQLQTVKPGEVVTARCTWNTTGVDHDTHIGSTGGDEMCNLYIMFFVEPGQTPDYLGCVDEMAGNHITRGLPEGSDVPPPKNELLEARAKNSSVNTGVKEMNYANLFAEELEKSESKKKGGTDDGAIMVADFNFTMPGAKPTSADEYWCTSLKMSDLTEDPVWAIKFEAVASGNHAHHMILSKCKDPPGKEGDMWDCRHHHMCRDSSKIMYAWAKHGDPTELPNDVGFAFQKDDHLVLQVHYAKPLSEPDHSGISIKFRTTPAKYTAGMFLLGVSTLNIPADTAVTHGDANCKVDADYPLHVFAYRTHAHNFGSVISGYRYSPNTHDWQILAKGNPNWPQTFYPMQKEEWVHPGEYLTARCSYNTTGHHTSTKIGPEGGDEMCNLYLMYYTLSTKDDFKICFDEQDHSLSSQLPKGNDVPLPPNPELEEKAHGESSADLTYANGGREETLLSSPDKKSGGQSSGVRKRPGADNSNVKKKPGVEDNGREGKNLPGSDFSTVPNWPSKETADTLGQLSGVAIDIYGNAVIFHRGDRTWNGNTFNNDNTYGEDRNVPIQQNTVLTVNSTGHIINSWGSNLFFLPHMITVDSKNNVWMTDVALHQVFKFPPYGGDHTPLITLGEKFVPGSDDRHFCKPTAIAVSEDTNTFFVSDGYCNSRVIKYTVTVTGNGKHVVNKVKQWGKGAGGPFSITQGPYSFNVPHGLALAEERNEICVADRENGRVQCFNTESGDFTQSIQPPEFGSRIFSVAYTPANGGRLHAVSGPEFNPFGRKPTGYIINLATGALEGTWQVPGGLQNPHDIAVSRDGGTVYAVELHPFTVWKLTNGQPSTTSSSSSSSQSLPPSPAVLSPTNSQGGTQSLPNIMEGARKLMPDMSGSVVLAAAISVPLSLLIVCCLAIRKCRKRGKGTKFVEKKAKNWSVGDILGRSKDGFQPLNTDEKDGMLGDESDSEVEEFSVPALHA